MVKKNITEGGRGGRGVFINSTQRISSGMKSSLHFRDALSILAAFFTFQLWAAKYLEMDASEQ